MSPSTVNRGLIRAEVDEPRRRTKRNVEIAVHANDARQLMKLFSFDSCGDACGDVVSRHVGMVMMILITSSLCRVEDLALNRSSKAFSGAYESDDSTLVSCKIELEEKFH